MLLRTNQTTKNIQHNGASRTEIKSQKSDSQNEKRAAGTKEKQNTKQRTNFVAVRNGTQPSTSKGDIDTNAKGSMVNVKHGRTGNSSVMLVNEPDAYLSSESEYTDT